MFFNFFLIFNFHCRKKTNSTVPVMFKIRIDFTKENFIYCKCQICITRFFSTAFMYEYSILIVHFAGSIFYLN